MKALTWLAAGLGATAAVACEPPPGAVQLQAADPDAPELFLWHDGMPMSQPFSLSLSLCQEGAAEITVDAVMPAHQHGMNYTPEVIALSDGTYAVHGMVFHMPGLWRITVELRNETGLSTYHHEVRAQ